MPQARHLEYTATELIAALLRENNIKTGIWELTMRTKTRGVVVDMGDGDVQPSIVTQIHGIGIALVDTANAATVDAATIWNNEFDKIELELD